MRPAHIFAEKKEASLSLVWLDENFQQTADKCQEIDDRMARLAGMMAEHATILIQLNEAVRKLGDAESLADRVIALLKGKKK